MKRRDFQSPATPVKTELTSRSFTEHYSAQESRRHGLRRLLVKKRTRFQDAVLADFHAFGRTLVLDGEIQSTEMDEFIYHEALVQPAMTLVSATSVLVLGGGEGATVREILRHASVKSVTMVDIDGEVVDFCREYLTQWHQGALKSAKLRLEIKDAGHFVSQTKEKFDVIYSDLPTPLKPGPLSMLYSSAFYRKIASRLSRAGIFVVQAGSGSLPQMGFHTGVTKTLSKVFRYVRPYYAFVPSFEVPWAFLFCSDTVDPLRVPATQIDRRLGTLSRTLQFYDGQCHEGLFRVPKYYRRLLKNSRQLV